MNCARYRKATPRLFLFVLFALSFGVNTTHAQTTAFTFQGRLTEAGSPATGNYILQFKLFDALSDGTQIGATIADVTVTATNGAFTTALDFGAGAFDGAERFLEISVKKLPADPYTILAPRQPIVSAPYAVRTLSSAQADLAFDSTSLGGIAASQYVTTSSLGSAFIKNDVKQQIADFNISGNGTLGGNLGANTVTAQTGTGFYGLTQTDGTTTLSTYVGGSASGATGAWFGTQSNSPLHFFTNNGQPQMTILQNGNVGIGTFDPQAKLHLAGNAVQERDKGGMIKAMLNIAADGTIIRCYNGITGSSTGNCGFTVSAGSSGTYVVNLGFQVNDRFLSVVARGINPPIGTGLPPTTMSADYRFSSLPNANPNEVFIDIFRADNGATANNPFMLIVY
jgi:hypothetical protein